MPTKYYWHESGDYSSLDSISQVYGLCFDDSGQVLIIKEPGEAWNIPGGTPEAGETPEQTLNRELKEEADVIIGQCNLIGYYEVISNKPTFHQLRFACKIISIEAQTLDPSTGVVNERKFVLPREFFDYVKIDDYQPMLEAAIKWYKNSLT